MDGWLLIRVHDGCGPLMLAKVLALRSHASGLLRRRLQHARISSLAAVDFSAEDEQPDDSSADACGFPNPLVRELLAVDELVRRQRQEQQDLGPDSSKATHGDPHNRTPDHHLPEDLPGAASSQKGSRPEAADPSQGLAPWNEDRLAAELALALRWPVRYSVEQISTLKVTSQYVLPEVQPVESLTLDGYGAPRQRAGVKVRRRGRAAEWALSCYVAYL